VEQVGEPAEPVWNFHKLLIGKDGKLVNVFGPRTDPLDPEIKAAVEEAL
jgi:glutathione peroxidase